MLVGRAEAVVEEVGRLAVQPEQYEIHAVWTVLDSIHDLLNGDLQPWDDDSRYDVRRLQAATEFADGLRDIDPVLVEPQGLTPSIRKSSASSNGSTIWKPN